MPLISIVVPMYNEEAVVADFFARINKVVSDVPGYDFEIVVVNDGSNDATLALIKEQQAHQNNIVIVNLARNFGHEPAVSAGLHIAKGEAVIPIDADLQDPPEIIPAMIQKYEAGFEVVNARRASRKEDSFMKRFTAKKFYDYMTKISGKIKVPSNVGHYRLISRRVVDEVNALSESTRVFRVEVPYIGHKTTEVLFSRQKRTKGQSHYNYHAMFDLAFNAIISSSIKPVYWPLWTAIWIGFLTGLSLLAELVFFILAQTSVLNLAINFELWLIINSIFVVGSIMLLVLGIISIYVGKTFIEAQGRPFYVIDEVLTKKEK
ncbi:MAG TPA: glycosyltransferase family 2 protein [Bacilli bacterium]|nr:glycosyltransferase family 2 protein [Bacilli bacterium]